MKMATEGLVETLKNPKDVRRSQFSKAETTQMQAV
jgi:hypothetical protein